MRLPNFKRPIWYVGGIAATAAALLLITRRKSSATATTKIQDFAPPNNAKPLPAPGGPAVLPPIPKAAGAFVYIPDWYKPKDDLSKEGIANATVLTVRQIQAAFNALGASLDINGYWNLPTQQAVWDFQYIHQNDNPQTPLSLTGEIDQLTETAIKTVYGNAVGVQTGFR